MLQNSRIPPLLFVLFYGVVTSILLVAGEECGCGASWTELNRSCYMVISEFKYFEEAEKDCVSRGAHLVTISSARENRLVHALFRRREISNSYWIGLFEKAKNDWQWKSGEPVVYKNWEDSEPNDHGGQQDHAAMHSKTGKWFDSHGDEGGDWVIVGYICEKIPGNCRNEDCGATHALNYIFATVFLTAVATACFAYRNKMLDLLLSFRKRTTSFRTPWTYEPTEH